MPSPLADRGWLVFVGALGALAHGCDEAPLEPAGTVTPSEVEVAAVEVGAREVAPPAVAAEPRESPAGDVVPAQHQVPAGRACPVGTALIEGGALTTLERGPAVRIEPFCLDLDEVSVAEFRACVRDGRCDRACAPGARCPEVPARTDWRIPGEDDVVSRFCNGGREGADEHPVNCVSFEEAIGYCAAQGKRLPTGDEWEWASRSALSRRASPWGTAVATDEICWGKPHKRAGTCARGAHPKDLTAQNVRAMGGGLSEWVSAPARARSGKAAASGARWAYGASWYAIDDGYARAALGGVQMPARRAETVGFRCAL